MLLPHQNARKNASIMYKSLLAWAPSFQVNKSLRKPLPLCKIACVSTVNADTPQTAIMLQASISKWTRVFHYYVYFHFCPVKHPPGPPRGYSQKNWLGVCGPLPKTLTLFMTEICDIPYPIHDLTKNWKPYLWPDSGPTFAVYFLSFKVIWSDHDLFWSDIEQVLIVHGFCSGLIIKKLSKPSSDQF